MTKLSLRKVSKCENGNGLERGGFVILAIAIPAIRWGSQARLFLFNILNFDDIFNYFNRILSVMMISF